MTLSEINKEVHSIINDVENSATYKYRKHQYRQKHDNDVLGFQIYEDAGGTITATLNLQVSYPDANVWTTVPDGTFTAATSGTFVPGKDLDIRWNCSVYSAGTIHAVIGG